MFCLGWSYDQRILPSPLVGVSCCNPVNEFNTRLDTREVNPPVSRSIKNPVLYSNDAHRDALKRTKTHPGWGQGWGQIFVRISPGLDHHIA